MFIENCAAYDIWLSDHTDPGPNSMLIQIMDPASEFPVPIHKFKETYQFVFLDIDETDFDKHPDLAEAAIDISQARELARLLLRAKKYDMNVIVHCVAGVCRSGAVVEIGTMLGFEDCTKYRQPNIRVKRMLMEVLNLKFDPNNSVFGEDNDN